MSCENGLGYLLSNRPWNKASENSELCYNFHELRLVSLRRCIWSKIGGIV